MRTTDRSSGEGSTPASLRFIFIIAALVGAPSAHGFIQTRTAGGTPVSWGGGNTLTFRANTTNTSGLAANALLDIFTTSLNRWKNAASNGFNFVYYQGTNTGTYPNYTGSTVDNSIFFTSNGSNSGDQLGCGTVAVTQVWYNSGNGGAFKADVRFNDQCFRFTTTPSDTASQRNIYLPDVTTHELGHALGLDHSQNLQSSMVYTAWIQEAYLSCDDHAAMNALYSSNTNYGNISGRVLSPSGSPLFGAIVEAVSLERGKAVVSAITEADGSFNIRGVEVGNYAIVTSPFYPGAASLSRYFAGMNTSVCGGGTAFARTTAMVSGGLARTVAVSRAGTSAFGDVTVSCSSTASPFSGAERYLGTAPRLVQNGTLPAATASAFSGSAGAAGSTHYYLLQGMTGAFLVHAAAHSLYSRSDVTVDLLDRTGARLAGAQSFDNVFIAPNGSGYTNYDSQASLSLGSSPTDIIVRVTQRATLANGAFPSGSTGVDSAPFYVLTVSRGVSAANIAYEMNARCEAQDSFSAYAQAGDPGTMPGAAAPSSQKKSGGCGMIQYTGDDEGPFSGGGAHTRMGNFLLLALAMMVAHRAGRLVPRQKMPQQL